MQCCTHSAWVMAWGPSEPGDAVGFSAVGWVSRGGEVWADSSAAPPGSLLLLSGLGVHGVAVTGMELQNGDHRSVKAVGSDGSPWALQPVSTRPGPNPGSG